MALKVPTSGGPSVRSTPDQTPFKTTAGTSADTFGAAGARAQAGIGKALALVSDIVGGIAERQLLENNVRAAKQLDTQFGNALLTIGHGDGGENKGFYALRGQAALDSSAATINDIKEMQTKMLETVNNPAVRRMFEGTSQARIDRESGFIFRHNSAQRRVADIAASQARMKEFSDYAMLNFQNDEVLDTNSRLMFIEGLTAAQAAGMGGEAANSAAQAAQSALIENVVRAAISGGDTQRANDIFNKALAAGHIDGAVVPGIQDMLKDANDIAGAQQAAEAAMAAHPNDLPAQLAFARANLSGRAERDTVAEIKMRSNERATAIKAVRAQAEGDAANFVAGGGSLKDFARQNPQQYGLLTRDVEAFNRIRKLEDNLAKGQTFATVSDGHTFLETMELNDEDFARLNLITVRGNVTESEFNRLITTQRAAAKAIETMKSNPKPFNDAFALFKRMAPQSFNVGRVDEIKGVKAIQRELRAFVQSSLDAGKPPTSSETAAEIMELKQELIGDTRFGPGGGFSLLVAEADRMTEAQKEAADVKFIEDVPEHIKELMDRMAQAVSFDWRQVPDDVLTRVAAQIALGRLVAARNIMSEFIEEFLKREK